MVTTPGAAAEPERVQSAEQVRFEPSAARVAKFGGRPPLDLDEFTLVRTQGLPHTRPARANHRLTSTCRVAGGPTVSVIVRK